MYVTKKCIFKTPFIGQLASLLASDSCHLSCQNSQLPMVNFPLSVLLERGQKTWEAWLIKANNQFSKATAQKQQHKDVFVTCMIHTYVMDIKSHHSDRYMVWPWINPKAKSQVILNFLSVWRHQGILFFAGNLIQYFKSWGIRVCQKLLLDFQIACMTTLHKVNTVAFVVLLFDFKCHWVSCIVWSS